MENNSSLIKPAPASHKKISRLLLWAIILGCITLVLCVILYFLGPRQAPYERSYTDDEKAALIEDVARQTEEQGLPPVQKQIDIMKYNAQE